MVSRRQTNAHADLGAKLGYLRVSKISSLCFSPAERSLRSDRGRRGGSAKLGRTRRARAWVPPRSPTSDLGRQTLCVISAGHHMIAARNPSLFRLRGPLLQAHAQNVLVCGGEATFRKSELPRA